MRAMLLVAAACALCTAAVPAAAQGTVDTRPPAVTRPSRPLPPPIRPGDHLEAAQDSLAELDASLERNLERLDEKLASAAARADAAQERAEIARERVLSRQDRKKHRRPARFSTKHISADPEGVQLPPDDSIASAALTVAAGESVGRVASRGQLDVFGTVEGDAVAIGGDVVVHQAGRVTGDAVSIGGTVKLDGGTVAGEMRSIDRAVQPVKPASRSTFLATLGEMQVIMGCLVVMVLLGFATMVLAEDRLRVVTDTIEDHFGRSVVTGLLAEVSFAPLLIAVPVLLIVTIVGIVIAPFAVLGLIVLAAGLATLGFLGMARVAGQALTRRAQPASARGTELRAMLAGLFVFFGLWLVAALLGWVPVLGALLHGLAVVATWAAATVGLGAAVISRGGGRRRTAATSPPMAGVVEPGWQTPTPISGIAAARRPASHTPEA